MDYGQEVRHPMRQQHTYSGYCWHYSEEQHNWQSHPNTYNRSSAQRTTEGLCPSVCHYRLLPFSKLLYSHLHQSWHSMGYKDNIPIHHPRLQAELRRHLFLHGKGGLPSFVITEAWIFLLWKMIRFRAPVINSIISTFAAHISPFARA